MTDQLAKDYKRLLEKVKDSIVLQSVQMLVDWDRQTMMPPKGISLRSQQLSLLSRIEHKISTDPEIGKLLKDITQSTYYEDLNTVQKRNIYLIQKRYDEQTALPEKLVAEIAKQRAIAVDAWKKAKAAKNYAMFKPDLEKIVDLQKKAADILMNVKKTATSYDALLDVYEPKMTTETITKVLNQLRTGLILILRKCENSQNQPNTDILWQRVPIETQRRISKALTEFIGYDVSSKEAGGRIDETEHPFATGYYDDVRITMHYYEDDFAAGMFGLLHEAGHAIYEQNLRQEWIYQPVGTAASYGFSESQSRMMENIIGRSQEFWSYFLPNVKIIASSLDLDLKQFVHAINRVEPSKIRLEADEVSYGLHITVRFNLERDLFADKVTVEELPEIWNQSYEKYLGVKIENDSEGLMQDIHWASGLFGYFPTYALGNIYSGQIMETMEKTLPDWRKQVALGKIKVVTDWLTKNVHSYGNLYDPPELIKKIVGKELNVKPYLKYLEQKCSELYGF